MEKIGKSDPHMAKEETICTKFPQLTTKKLFEQ